MRTSDGSRVRIERSNEHPRIPGGVVTGEAFETRHAFGARLPSHRHHLPYVALVLDGAYYEASADGLWRCAPGTFIVHPLLHAHANWFPESDVRVLNVSVERMPPDGIGRGYGVWKAGRSLTAEVLRDHDPSRLLAALTDSEPITPVSAPESVEAAALALRSRPSTSIGAAARKSGVSREYIARAFRRHFGLPPRAFRAEHRMRLVLRLLADNTIPLTLVALDAGFADQAHLTRTVRSATGMSPALLRRWLSSVIEGHIRSSE